MNTTFATFNSEGSPSWTRRLTTSVKPSGSSLNHRRSSRYVRPSTPGALRVLLVPRNRAVSSFVHKVNLGSPAGGMVGESSRARSSGKEMLVRSSAFSSSVFAG
jgi:hypothetical protein